MSDLHFSLGNENNRGTLPSTINKIMEGQLSVGISSKRLGVRSKGKLIGGSTYDNWHLTADTSKDARVYLDISDDLRIPINAYFSDYSHFASCIESISNNNNLKKVYLLGTTGTDTTPMYDTDIFISDTTKGALTSKYLLLNNSLGIGVTDFVTDKSFHVKGNSKLEGVSEFAAGHLYLTGASLSSSTANTTQIVFGTATNNHIAISSEENALVLNPDVSTTTNQIALYLDKVSQIPSGISTGSLVVKGNTTLGDNYKEDTFKVNATTTYNGTVYFANGTTYYINESAQGKLYNLALAANTSSTSTTTGTLKVTGGAGISENLYIGGLLNVAGNTVLGNNSTVDTVTVNAATTLNNCLYLGTYGALGYGTIPSGYCEFSSTVFTPSSDSVWLVTKGSGNNESAGFYCDGNTIKFWCPGDEVVEFLDSDNGTSKTYIDIKTKSITASGSITATGDISTSGNMSATKLHLTSTTDAAGTQNNTPALVIGPETGKHIEIDNDEIIAKDNASTIGTLYLQSGGGDTSIGGETTIGGALILKNAVAYGTSLPSTGSTGQVFFKLI